MPIGVWSSHVRKYLPPDPARPLPLSTPPEDSVLRFRLNPDFNDPLPDKVMITVIAEATGLPGSGGASLSAVQFTYKK